MASRKDEILNKSDGGLAIFRHFIPTIPPDYRKGKKFKSPFRDEKTPSANLVQQGGIWLYKDFGNDEKAINAIDFIMKFKGCSFTEALDIGADFANLPPIERPPAKPITYILPDEKVVEFAIKLKNTALHRYCMEVLGIPESHLNRWFLGGRIIKKEVWTSFIFHDGNDFINIKSVLYDDASGKRIRERTFVNEKGVEETVKFEPQSLFLSKEEQAENKRYGFCLFGAHLVRREEKNIPLVIVESEKTAIIASWFYPDYDFVSCHGVTGGNDKEFLALMQDYPEKPVIVLCDADPKRKVPTIFTQLEALKWNVHLVDLMPERMDKSDLADYIHERLKVPIPVPRTRQVIDKDTGDNWYEATKPEWASGKETKKLTPREKRQQYRKWLSDQNKNPKLDEKGNPLPAPPTIPSDLIPDDAFTDDYDPLPAFLKTGIYMYQNCFWTIKDDAPKVISNFTFTIVKEIKNKKNVVRLVELKNIMGECRIVEMEAKDMVTLTSFQVFCLDQGYFEFMGSPDQLAKLRHYSGEYADKAETLELLGWQRKTGFWAWANGIVDNGEFLACNENGLVTRKGKTYFIPYANESNDSIDIEYPSERRVIYEERLVNFNEWSSLHFTVHGLPGMVGQMFAIMTLFSDLIARVQGGFPIIMLYGEGSSGKGALARSIQCLFGQPQDGIPLNNNSSTIKGKIRSFAQFVNMPVLLEEYVVDKFVDEFIKTIWDRLGYKIAQRDSKTSTTTIPILCSAIVTGNQYPVAQPLIQRLLIMEMHENQRNVQQLENYNRLQSYEKGNLSAILTELLSLRAAFEEHFETEYRTIQSSITSSFPKLEGSRMYSNAATMLATYKLASRVFKMPYTYSALETFLQDSLEMQVRKLVTGGEAASFFETISYGITKHEIKEGTHFAIDGDFIYINVGSVMAIYNTYCRQVTNTMPVAKSTLIDKLKSFKGFESSLASYRIGKETRTSAMCFNHTRIDVDIIASARIANPTPASVSGTTF